MARSPSKAAQQKSPFPSKWNERRREHSFLGKWSWTALNFDVRFRSKSFLTLAELGDKLIYDDFTIGFS